tara:strand:+ start:2497 stop:3507 length:1011 start_codon:yes stop_codon:yes gene_type:complete
VKCRRNIRVLLIVCVSVVALVVAPLIGYRLINPLDVLGGGLTELELQIFWDIRVPRVCLGALAGAGLGLSGMVFQAMFRNVLATPYTLGVSSGASLGAALYVVLGLQFSLAGIAGVSLWAFAGAALAILLVYGITLMRPGFSAASTLLAGVAVSFFFSSLILFAQYLSDFSGSYRIVRWLMGGFGLVGYQAVFSVLPFVASGVALVAYLLHELNLLTVGDDVAASRGVDCVKTRRLLFFATSLMVGGIVAVCGPIGFIGMMAPHICRLLVGHDHLRLMPATLAFGAAFLVLCDGFARAVTGSYAEIPVGVITALLGGPFFLWLLVSDTGGGRLMED